MHARAFARLRRGALAVAVLLGAAALARAGDPATQPDKPGAPPAASSENLTPSRERQTPPPASELVQVPPPVPLVTRLDPNYRPIDLNTALRLAGVQNPDLLLARQRVVEAVALRQQFPVTRVRLLPIRPF
jgi:hypothetical protein